jgi:hypothetical protein
MKTTIPTPEFKISKRMVSPIEIDMWNIKGRYEYGKWHELIHAIVKNWAAKKQFQGKGSIWSTVRDRRQFRRL